MYAGCAKNQLSAQKVNPGTSQKLNYGTKTGRVTPTVLLTCLKSSLLYCTYKLFKLCVTNLEQIQGTFIQMQENHEETMEEILKEGHEATEEVREHPNTSSSSRRWYAFG